MLWAALATGGMTVAAIFFLRPAKPSVPPPPAVARAQVSAPAGVPPAASPPPAAGPRLDRDYRAEVAALRSRGLTEASIREIITGELLHYRQREQYRAELLIEQGRYAPHYWELPPAIETIGELERLRQNELARLDQEVNGELKDLFGSAAAPPPVARPLFGPDSPGPKIDFLPPASQQRLAEALFNQDPDAKMSSVDRMDFVRQLLAPDEFDLYAKWNSPAAVSLGSELVGFGANQAEFDAIYQWQSVADSEQGFPSGETRVEADNQLKAALGPDRYAAFEHLQDPAYQTVAQMLNRWGLPSTSADKVLALRQSAMSAMDAIWQDSTLSDEEKAARVEKTRQQFRQQITAQLGLPPGLVPDDDLL